MFPTSFLLACVDLVFCHQKQVGDVHFLCKNRVFTTAYEWVLVTNEHDFSERTNK
jgi:hypothetical protein